MVDYSHPLRFHRDGSGLVAGALWQEPAAPQVCPSCHRTGVTMRRNITKKVMCLDCIVIKQRYPLNDKDGVTGREGRLVNGQYALVFVAYAIYWTSARLDKVSRQIEVRPSSKVFADALTQMMRDPPEPPYMLIEFGKRTAIETFQVNYDKRNIWLSGNMKVGGVPLRHGQISRCMDLCAKFPALNGKDWMTVTAARAGLASGATSATALEKNRKLLDNFYDKYQKLSEARLPMAGSDDLRLLVKVAG